MGRSNTGGGGESLTGEDVPPVLFFSRQVTHKYNDTQAILPILLNLEVAVEDEKLGETKGRERGTTSDRATGSKPLLLYRLVLGKTLPDL